MEKEGAKYKTNIILSHVFAVDVLDRRKGGVIEC